MLLYRLEVHYLIKRFNFAKNLNQIFLGIVEALCDGDEELLPCGNGQCYYYEFKCDGENDCSNGADELGCREFLIFGFVFLSRELIQFFH